MFDVMDIAIYDHLLFIVAGTLLGYIAGLIPGVGNTIMLLISYPLILNESLLNMLLFYVALISVSQFSGSIVATVFGVPGESSSMPAVAEGKKLFMRGVGNFAISNAAMGSVLGSFMTVGAVYLILPWALELIKTYSGMGVKLSILILATLSVIFMFGKSILTNFILFGIGIFLALVGHNDIPWFVFLPQIIPYETFPKLLGGLPLFPVIVSLYAFPLLLNSREQFKNFDLQKNYIDNNPIRDHIREFYKNIRSAFRGGSWGCVLGFIPHMGTILGSTMSYVYEQRLGRRKKTFREDGDIKSLVAAETANNSAIFTGILPLLLLGIPTASSEALILGFAEANRHVVNFTTTIETDLFHMLVVGFVITNVMALLLSWPAVRYVNVLTKIKMNHIFYLTLTILAVLVYYTGSIEMDEWYFISVMVALLPLGYFLRHTEPLVLLVAFLLSEKIMSSTVAFYQIHFG
jgi:putative tricarboxylic transport membrane protein